MIVKDIFRFRAGIFLVLIATMIIYIFGFSTIVIDQIFKHFLWTLSWSFYGLGFYVILLGVIGTNHEARYGTKPERDNLEKVRKYFNYTIFLIATTALVASWLGIKNISDSLRYLTEFGVGLILGVWIDKFIPMVSNCIDAIPKLISKYLPDLPKK
ncbi:MAG: hypothetical protein ACOYBJ_01025 [Patescibacteria group bacterium]|jgi:hypothetical protein